MIKKANFFFTIVPVVAERNTSKSATVQNVAVQTVIQPILCIIGFQGGDFWNFSYFELKRIILKRTIIFPK